MSHELFKPHNEMFYHLIFIPYNLLVGYEHLLPIIKGKLQITSAGNSNHAGMTNVGVLSLKGSIFNIKCFIIDYYRTAIPSPYKNNFYINPEDISDEKIEEFLTSGEYITRTTEVIPS